MRETAARGGKRAVRRHQAAGAGAIAERGARLGPVLREPALARRHAHELPDDPEVDRALQGADRADRRPRKAPSSRRRSCRGIDRAIAKLHKSLEGIVEMDAPARRAVRDRRAPRSDRHQRSEAARHSDHRGRRFELRSGGDRLRRSRATTTRCARSSSTASGSPRRASKAPALQRPHASEGQAEAARRARKPQPKHGTRGGRDHAAPRRGRGAQERMAGASPRGARGASGLRAGLTDTPSVDARAGAEEDAAQAATGGARRPPSGVSGSTRGTGERVGGDLRRTVKALREQTGAGMMDCKKALADGEGDLKRAAELLRERGLAKAGKREGRASRARARHRDRDRGRARRASSSSAARPTSSRAPTTSRSSATDLARAVARDAQAAPVEELARRCRSTARRCATASRRGDREARREHRRASGSTHLVGSDVAASSAATCTRAASSACWSRSTTRDAGARRARRSRRTSRCTSRGRPDPGRGRSPRGRAQGRSSTPSARSYRKQAERRASRRRSSTRSSRAGRQVLSGGRAARAAVREGSRQAVGDLLQRKRPGAEASSRFRALRTLQGEEASEA